MPRVIHFEVHADEPLRAIEFYEDVFGWTFTQWGEQEYWTIKTGIPESPGIDGGLVPRRTPIDGQTVTAFICTIDVASVDQYVQKVIAAGGFNVIPKMAIPGVGWLAYCKDTEGNIFGMMEEDETAAIEINIPPASQPDV